MQKIIILHNRLLNNTADEADVLAQRDLVHEACAKLGIATTCMTVGDDLKADMQKVVAAKPDVVFNLVESLWGKGELIYFAPAILNAHKISYSGVPLEALFVTTNKVLAKKMMRLYGLPTADFFGIDEITQLNPKKTYIAKPIWEEASLGIDGDAVFSPLETEKVKRIARLSPAHFFVEEFIEGREFNVSILAGSDDPEVLPPAEILFSAYFDDKPKVVDYKAKWDETSEEYQGTQRAFDTLENKGELKKKLSDICLQSWRVFNLHGYARIDFRVDVKGMIYILEINGNPCISPDSGFVAALEKAGYTRETMIQRILNDSN
jgi:D-alanine-D-alanine ligase